MNSLLGSGNTIPEAGAFSVAERFILSADLYDLASAYRWAIQASSTLFILADAAINKAIWWHR